MTMEPPRIASREDWLAARRDLLEQEKAHTRMRDEITAARQALPWVPVEKEYVFETSEGERNLGALFGTHSQLLVYHFMFGPDWETGCVSCSYWADNFNGISPHLAARDIAFVAASRAPLARFTPFKERMGWQFDWVSSAPSTFNADFNVSFDPDAPADGPLMYNFRELEQAPSEELPGISAFAKTPDGRIFHTYSAYSRGLDIANTAYSFMDMCPKGRDEAELSYPMSWVRHHDAYASQGG